MEYILINYGLNKTFNIHKDVFEQSLNLVLENNKQVELDGQINIRIVENNTNVKVSLNFWIIDPKASYENVINKLFKDINQQIFALIGVETTNTQINCLGRKK